MNVDCKLVVFSNKAYNAIIRESFEKDPVETGGILLGHILDNGIWIVMEVLPPGINSIFQYAYFEYDESFVNYLAQSVANQYKKPLDLLGLWHRHPGSLDTFSKTDDATNITFACQNPKGVISGLVNIDPRFRFTLYHLAQDFSISKFRRPCYSPVEIAVGDDLIPEEYFQLKFYNGDGSELHPFHRIEEFELKHRVRKNQETPEDMTDSDLNDMESEGKEKERKREIFQQKKSSNDFFYLWKNHKKKWLYIFGAMAIGFIVFFSFKASYDSFEETKNLIKDHIKSQKISPSKKNIENKDNTQDSKSNSDSTEKDNKKKHSPKTKK